MVAALAPALPSTDELAEAIELEEARRHLLPFVRRLSPYYRVAPHHRLIADALEAVGGRALDRLVITMPPRHGKSELASKHFPAWFLGRNPDLRVIACSYAAALANRFSKAARSLVASPAWPFAVGLAPDSAQVQEWDIAFHRGGYLAAGVGGPVTGKGADLLIVDDAVKNAEEADSPVMRDAVWEWWQDTAYPRLQADARAIVIGTRWHEDDLIGRLLAAQSSGGDRWHVLHLAALSGEEAGETMAGHAIPADPLGRAPGEALWPDAYPVAELLRRKANMSSRMWAAQYQGRPVPAEGGTFKRHWWRRYGALPKLARVELFVDSAFKEGVANDYSVIAVWGADGDGDSYALRVWRERVAFPDLIRAVHDVHAWAKGAFGVAVKAVVIEDKASGQSAIQTLGRPYHTEGGKLPKLPVVAWEIPAGASKLARAEGVTHLVEGGRAHLPQSAPWVEDFIVEHETFPTGAHDDQVDTTSMALARLDAHAARKRLVSF